MIDLVLAAQVPAWIAVLCVFAAADLGFFITGWARRRKVEDEVADIMRSNRHWLHHWIHRSLDLPDPPAETHEGGNP